MKGRKVWEIGGFVAGAVLIVFGAVAIYLGVTGYTTTRDAIKAEGITFGSTDDPSNPAGTSDEEAALKDETGNTVSNSFRNQWVTETALSTALNVSYMAEQLSIFGIVVGVALFLAGIGFLILAFVVFGVLEPKTEKTSAFAPTAPAAG